MEPQNPQSENDNSPDNINIQPQQEPVAPQQTVPASTPQPEQTYQQPVTPMAFSQQSVAAAPAPHAQNSPGTIILQWLTYAFWGWTVLAFGVLIATVLSHIIADAEVGSSIPYELAAVIVLLPISLIIDRFYSKSEPEKKTGAATIVMVIHAVIFALFGIGAVIFAVFALVRMFVSASDTSDSLVMLASSAIITIVYGAVLLRTINPSKLPWIQKGFSLFMIALLTITAIVAIAGPVVSERSRKNDKLIEENLSSITYAISEYANEEGRLPASLNDLDLNEDAQTLVDNKRLKYTQDTQKTTIHMSSRDPADAESTPIIDDATLYYTLCATFDKASEDKNEYGYTSKKDKDGYSRDVNAYEHGAGEVCYKVYTDVYGY